MVVDLEDVDGRMLSPNAPKNKSIRILIKGALRGHSWSMLGDMVKVVIRTNYAINGSGIACIHVYVLQIMLTRC